MPKYLTVSSNGILLFVDRDIIWNCLQFFRTLLLHLTTGGRKRILSHLLTLILRCQSVEYFSIESNISWRLWFISPILQRQWCCRFEKADR